MSVRSPRHAEPVVDLRSGTGAPSGLAAVEPWDECLFHQEKAKRRGAARTRHSVVMASSLPSVCATGEAYAQHARRER